MNIEHDVFIRFGITGVRVKHVTRIRDFWFLRIYPSVVGSLLRDRDLSVQFVAIKLLLFKRKYESMQNVVKCERMTNRNSLPII